MQPTLTLQWAVAFACIATIISMISMVVTAVIRKNHQLNLEQVKNNHKQQLQEHSYKVADIQAAIWGDGLPWRVDKCTRDNLSTCLVQILQEIKNKSGIFKEEIYPTGIIFPTGKMYYYRVSDISRGADDLVSRYNIPGSGTSYRKLINKGFTIILPHRLDDATLEVMFPKNLPPVVVYTLCLHIQEVHSLNTHHAYALGEALEKELYKRGLGVN